ncbi:MAG: hypothetical protein ACK5NT_00490 [Pyrinomonadaceae bacterium]
MNKKLIPLAFILMLATFALSFAQDTNDESKNAKDVRVMTIPVSIFTKEELKKNRLQEFVDAGTINVMEDGEEQTLLSLRSISQTPLSLGILIQDDLASGFNLNLPDIKSFIKSQPEGTRVMVAYSRGGSTVIRQKFTTDLQKAADAVRISTGAESLAPRSPYDGVIDIVKRFDGQPGGRRAIMMFSDGLDVSNGFRASTPGDSTTLSTAIERCQRSAIAVYGFYSSATYTETGNTYLISNGQGSLSTIADQTGGEAYFSGLFTPISYKPFFDAMNRSITRQFALSYLSTHLKKGYHKIKITTTNLDIRFHYPDGYYYR